MPKDIKADFRTSDINPDSVHVCQNCGQRKKVIGKYNIRLCKSCFRMLALVLGFKRYGVDNPDLDERLEPTPLTLYQLPKKDPEAFFYYFTDSTYTTKNSDFKKFDNQLTLLARNRTGLDVVIVDRDRGVSPAEWNFMTNRLGIKNYPALIVANSELGVKEVDNQTSSLSVSDVEYAVLENGIIAEQILKDVDEINEFLNALFDCARENEIKSGMRREKILHGLKIGKEELTYIISG